MKRRKRLSYDGCAYPTLDAGMDRRRFLAGLGSAAGTVVLSAHLIGCEQHLEGLLPGVSPDTYSAALPPSPDARWLYLSSGGTIAYRVEVTVTDLELRDWIVEETEALLEQLDDLFDTHPVTDFGPDGDPWALVGEITGLLADAFHGVENASDHAFDDVALVIDHYDEETEIDGDVASLRR